VTKVIDNQPRLPTALHIESSAKQEAQLSLSDRASAANYM